jgi:P4 family phage/plasmid primase-like protien
MDEGAIYQRLASFAARKNWSVSDDVLRRIAQTAAAVPVPPRPEPAPVRRQPRRTEPSNVLPINWDKPKRAQRKKSEAPSDDTPVVSRKTPLKTAEKFVEAERPHLHHHNGDWLDWNGAAYLDLEDDTVRAGIYAFLSRARVLAKDEDGSGPFNPQDRDVNKVKDALRALSHVPRERYEPPCWIEGGEGLPPREIIACRNGLLHVPTGRLLPPTSQFFTRNALEFDYVPAAVAPEWTKFLGGIWPEDQGSINTLQEMMGYLLTPETRLQAMFLLCGPPRSGRGTIGRVLRELVGPQNTCSPSLGKIGTPFGLEPLIAKQLALVGDLQLGSKTDVAALVEDLLRITGEDSISVNRKQKTAWEGRLAVRFVIMTNEVPRLPNASGALAARLVPLRFTKSWLGKEDRELDGRLRVELPGILNWAVEGWRRLRVRGHFLLPDASQEVLQEFADAASPVSAFVREECVVAPNASIEKTALYEAWCRWCVRRGRPAGTAETFGHELLAAMGERARSGRPRVNGKRLYTYEGIDLAPQPAAVPPAEADDPIFH